MDLAPIFCCKGGNSAASSNVVLICTSRKTCRVVSVGRSMIKKRMYLYEISEGPGLVSGETIDPELCAEVALPVAPSFCFMVVAAVLLMATQLCGGILLMAEGCGWGCCFKQLQLKPTADSAGI